MSTKTSHFNPFLVNVLILYPLKTQENLWLSGAFSEYKIGTLAKNGLIPRKKSVLVIERHRPASLRKMSLFHRCFSNILLVKTNNLVYP